MGMNKLALLRAMAAVMGPIPFASAMPQQKQSQSFRPHGRPKINAGRPKPERRDRQFLKNRHKLLPKALEHHKLTTYAETLRNRYYKSHRTPEQQAVYEERIIRMTAMRFDVQPNQQFPLQAIIKMADLGVREAVEQYSKLHQAAESLNISVRQAYDHFILGKELNNVRKAHELT